MEEVALTIQMAATAEVTKAADIQLAQTKED